VTHREFTTEFVLLSQSSPEPKKLASSSDSQISSSLSDAILAANSFLILLLDLTKLKLSASLSYSIWPEEVNES